MPGICLQIIGCGGECHWLHVPGAGWAHRVLGTPLCVCKCLCAKENDTVPRTDATAVPETNSRPPPWVAPRTKEAAPRWQQAGQETSAQEELRQSRLHPRALWHCVAEWTDRTTPSLAQRLLGGARASLRHRDRAPPTPRPANSWHGPALPQPPPALPAHRPANKSSRKIPRQRGERTPTLHTCLSWFVPLAPGPGGGHCRHLGQHEAQGDADCSSHAKQARSLVELPPTITPELQQGN